MTSASGGMSPWTWRKTSRTVQTKESFVRSTWHSYCPINIMNSDWRCKNEKCIDLLCHILMGEMYQVQFTLWGMCKWRSQYPKYPNLRGPISQYPNFIGPKSQYPKTCEAQLSLVAPISQICQWISQYPNLREAISQYPRENDQYPNLAYTPLLWAFFLIELSIASSMKRSLSN